MDLGTLTAELENGMDEEEIVEQVAPADESALRDAIDEILYAEEDEEAEAECGEVEEDDGFLLVAVLMEEQEEKKKKQEEEASSISDLLLKPHFGLLNSETFS